MALNLDGWDGAGLDALEDGVAEIDAVGRVVRCNGALAALAGLAIDHVIGRDLFRDILPGTDVPMFRGRFLEGTRRGGLSERFRFVFGFRPAPLLTAIRMGTSHEPDRYWIAIQALHELSPSRHRSAAMAVSAVERRIRAEPIDPGVCEREPIHIPGAVQPHATLLVCDPGDETLAVRACSDNAGEAFGGIGTEDVIGQTLAALLPAALVRDLGQIALTPGTGGVVRPLRRAIRLRNVPFSVEAHRHGSHLLIELERVAERPEDFNTTTPQEAQDAVNQLRSALTLEDAAASTAMSIRAMTGFERVLVYRFDADWNGSAVAEDKSAGWGTSLLGLRFPASDIPAQARALYTRSPARFVVDRDAVPAAVEVDPPAANEPVDMTFTHARALSPVHLEYQRNLGVNGSMSLSILVEGALWGLVIGHHRRPHYVTPDTRSLAGLVADAFALRVHELETLQIWRGQQSTLAAQTRLLVQMAQSDNFVTALTSEGEEAATLMDLFQSSGALVAGPDGIVCIGVTPPAEVLPALVTWLNYDLSLGRNVFATANLAGCFQPAEAWPDLASGVLAAFIGDGGAGHDHLLVWFRPEVTSTVAWGGDPNKPMLSDDRTRTVLPRRSFERWVEEQQGFAEPWASWQIDTAASMAAAIEGVILRQSRRIVALEAQGAALTAALEQKDVLAREIDHRVKNSLQIVANVMLLQARAVADPAAKTAFEDTYARVMSVARVHASLQQSEDNRSVDLGQTLRQLCDDLAAGMTGADQRLEVRVESGLMVSSQTAVALSLVATELVTNALKYAYAPGEQGGVEVSVKGREPGGVELRICDGGRGLPDDWAERAKVSAGRGGLGMRVIRAMLQQIGAKMEVGANLPGACFTVLA